MTTSNRTSGAIDRVYAATSKPPSAVEDLALLEAHLFHARALFESALERLGEDAATGGTELAEDLGELGAELTELRTTVEGVFTGVRSLRIRHAATVAHGDADLLAQIVDLRTTREPAPSAPSSPPADLTLKISPLTGWSFVRGPSCRCPADEACTCTARFSVGGVQ